MLTLNNDELFEVTGMRFDTIEDAYFYIHRTLEYFLFHNVNLTNDQRSKLWSVLDILECIDVN